METQIRWYGEDLLVVFPRLFHARAAADLREGIGPYLAEERGNVIVDMRAVRLLDSIGGGMLVELNSTIGARDARVILLGPRDEIRRKLELMQFHHVFEIINTLPPIQADPT